MGDGSRSICGLTSECGVRGVGGRSKMWLRRLSCLSWWLGDADLPMMAGEHGVTCWYVGARVLTAAPADAAGGAARRSEGKRGGFYEIGAADGGPYAEVNVVCPRA